MFHMTHVPLHSITTQFTVDTGKFTGRSPGDKWIVKNIGSESDANIDWGKVNQPTSPEVFDELYEKAVNYFNTKVSMYCTCLSAYLAKDVSQYLHLFHMKSLESLG